MAAEMFVLSIDQVCARQAAAVMLIPDHTHKRRMMSCIPLNSAGRALKQSLKLAASNLGVSLLSMS